MFERVMNAEQLATDRERDLELLNIKVESLENIIKKREQQGPSTVPSKQSASLKEENKS